MAALNKYYNFIELGSPRFLVSPRTDVYSNGLLTQATEMVCRGGVYRGLRCYAAFMAFASADL